MKNNQRLFVNPILLLTHNITVALRVMRRDWVVTFINIFGLSISLTAGLLVFQYTSYEFTYDRRLPDVENLYRVTATVLENSMIKYPSALTGTHVGPQLVEKFPQIKSFTRLLPTTNWFDCTLAYNSSDDIKIFNEKKLYYADPNALTVFNFTTLKGSHIDALLQPFTIVLSSSTAKKYFGDSDPIGKTLHLKGSSDDHDYTVTAVISDPNPASHVDVEILVSIASLTNNPRFKRFDTYTYLTVDASAKRYDLQTAIQSISTTLYPTDDTNTTELALQPISEIHLSNSYHDEMKLGGDLRSLNFLIFAAFVVIIIASINYVNLASSKAIQRASEVCIRKVSGATSNQITFQFLTETMLTVGFALGIASLATLAFDNHFFQMMGLNVSSEYIAIKSLGLSKSVVLLVVLASMLLAGLIPARLIASLNPVKALSRGLTFSQRGFSFRKGALMFQFSCAIVLLISVVTFRQQFRYMKSQDLKIDISNTIILKSPSNEDSTFLTRLQLFKDNLSHLAIVDKLATSTGVPGSGIGWTGEIRKQTKENSKNFFVSVIDTDFIDAYKLQLLTGRNFQATDFPIDAHFGNKVEPVILNKAAAIELGYDPIEVAPGQTIYWGPNKCMIVGVIENFHQESLKVSIKPTLYTANLGPNLSLKLIPHAAKDLTGSITTIRSAWNTYFPNNPFEWKLLDDDFQKQYEADERTASLFNFFCILALIITALGLFAISLFTATQRTKEVSIRKVLGASILNLFHLLSKEYLWLLLLAACIAIPSAHWITSHWLNGFAFHIEMTIWYYTLPLVFIFVVALFSLGANTLKVIAKNPADTLKHQ